MTLHEVDEVLVVRSTVPPGQASGTECLLQVSLQGGQVFIIFGFLVGRYAHRQGVAPRGSRWFCQRLLIPQEVLHSWRRSLGMHLETARGRAVDGRTRGCDVMIKSAVRWGLWLVRGLVAYMEHREIRHKARIGTRRRWDIRTGGALRFRGDVGCRQPSRLIVLDVPLEVCRSLTH